jgi:hypothetical protein
VSHVSGALSLRLITVNVARDVDLALVPEFSVESPDDLFVLFDGHPHAFRALSLYSFHALSKDCRK